VPSASPSTGRTGGSAGSVPKSDPIDAEAAARAVLAGVATAPAKRRDGMVESIRALRAARSGATRGPDRRDQPAQGPAGHRAGAATGGTGRPLHPGVGRRLRPVAPGRGRPGRSLDATKAALRVVACRVHQLDEEVSLADQRLAKLVGRAAPRLLELRAIGVDHAGQLLVTAGSAPSGCAARRPLRTCAGPRRSPPALGLPTGTGSHRGGDRGANRALHLAVVVRVRWCPRTRASAERRTKQGMSKPEILRCVKRYLAREAYHALVADFEALHAT
jgi:transposase